MDLSRILNPSSSFYNLNAETESAGTNSAQQRVIGEGNFEPASQLENRCNGVPPPIGHGAAKESAVTVTVPNRRPGYVARILTPSMVQEFRFMAILRCLGHKTWGYVADQFTLHFGKATSKTVLSRRWRKYKPSGDPLYEALVNGLPIPREWKAEVDSTLERYGNVDEDERPCQSDTPITISERRFIALLRCRGRQYSSFRQIAVKFKKHFGKPTTHKTMKRRLAMYKDNPDNFYRALAGEIPIPEQWTAEIDRTLQKCRPLPGEARRAIAPTSAEQMRFLTVLYTKGGYSWNYISQCYAERFGPTTDGEISPNGMLLRYRWVKYREKDGGLYNSISENGPVPWELEAEYENILERVSPDCREEFDGFIAKYSKSPGEVDRRHDAL
ncbi:MAG: hypothetical protein M1835_000199 [Candelina submexicana]|nr:MAG: hypothetical protein M1835_000199 [Candelina submexicana]